MKLKDKLQMVNYLNKCKANINAEYETHISDERLAELLSDYDAICKLERLIEEHTVVMSALSSVKKFVNNY